MGWRRIVAGLAAPLAATALAGCGSSSASAPSSLDPARVAPAGALLYVSVTVRPQGSQRAGVEAALHKLFGTRADAAIRTEADRLLRRAGTSYSGGVQKWLGERLGLVITGLSTGATTGVSKNDVAFIAPTSDAADARAFIRRALRKSPDAAGGMVGSYAVFGGPTAVRAIRAAAGGQTLASSAGYRSAMSALGSPVASAYVNLHSFAQLFARLPQAAALAPFLQQSLSRLSPDAALAMGVTMSGRQISLDLNETGVSRPPSRGAPGTVSGLPGNSWLAVATGGSPATAQGARQLRQGLQLGLLGALTRAGSAGAALAGRLGFIERDVLPALGPLTLSVAGTSPLAIAAGAEIEPMDMRAAGRLLGMLRRLAARDPSLQVSGGSSSFSVLVPTGTRLSVVTSAHSVVATYGFQDQQAFLHPGSTLAGNPVYRSAAALLPAGSSVPLFLEFAPITTFVQLGDHSPSAAKAIATLHKLRYLIAGGRSGHVRIVLGLN